MAPPVSRVLTVPAGSMSKTSVSSSASGQRSTPRGTTKNLARVEHYGSISEVDRETDTEHQEGVTSFIMLVPDERALLDDPQLVIIEVADNPRHVGLVRQRELLSQIDLVVDRF
jgi:hypothetical protein